MNYWKWKQGLVCLLLLMMSTVLVYAGGSSESDSKDVNVYSHRHYDVDAELYKEFTKRTGIQVNVISGGAGEIVERAATEGENTQADVFFVTGADILAQLKKNKSLQAIASSALGRVPKALRDPNKTWVAISKRARVIVYDKTKTATPAVTSYEDLVKGAHNIAIRSSSNSYNRMLLASIIYHNGETAARQWVRDLVAHMARPPQGNDRAQAKAVAAGIANYGVMNTYYVGLMRRSSSADEKKVGDALGIIFPNQDGRGTHVNVAGVGLSKYSKNKKNAIKLIEFLLSDYAQEKIAQENFEYPAVTSVSAHEEVQSWGSFKEDATSDLNKIGVLVPLAAKIADEEGWK